jgi:hypothetical protein
MTHGSVWQDIWTTPKGFSDHINLTIVDGFTSIQIGYLLEGIGDSETCM